MVGYEMLGEASNRKEFMKILVTGGAGYIGSVVVEQLIAAGVGEAVFISWRQCQDRPESA